MEKPIFSAQKIPEHISEKMIGKSIPIEYKDKVDISKLSYLQISHYGFDGNLHVGEMVVNSSIENEVIDIFKELYKVKYPIEKIRLIDEYDADDELSMEDNNSSCFCYRVVAGTARLSNHAKGMAIDINPLYNPYITPNGITPLNGVKYADRTLKNKYQIYKDDIVYDIFIKHGWTWGGEWNNKKDYQHFEKEL